MELSRFELRFRSLARRRLRSSGLLRLVVVSIYGGGVLLHQPSRSAAGLMIDGARALTLADNSIPKRDLAIAHTKAATLQD